MNTTRKLYKLAIPFLLAASMTTAHADPATGPGMMMGPGMMGGGYGGMGGPGMMMGPGMMGGSYAGMGGYGMMGMGGGMMGPGMMGMSRSDHMGQMNLSDSQIKQMRQIRSELQKTHYGLMQKMWEEQERLGGMYMENKPDSAEMGKVFDRINALQKEAFEARMNAERRMEAVLSKEQREQMQNNMRRWRMMNP